MEKFPEDLPAEAQEGLELSKKRETFSVNGGELERLEVRPENVKDPVPIVFAPGWVGNASVFEESMEVLARRGRVAFGFEAQHGIELGEDLEGIDEYPNAELRKVAALLATIEEQGAEQVDAIAHSEGGIYLTIAATLYPEKFRNIVLFDPGGMMVGDNAMRLTTSFVGDMVLQAVRMAKAHIFKSGEQADTEPLLRANRAKIRARHAVGAITSGFKERGVSAVVQNIKHAVQQVFAISDTDIYQMIADLQEKGVGVALITGKDDMAFPVKRLKAAAKHADIKDFYTRPGTHNELTLNPEYFMAQADRAMARLEASKDKDD